MLTLDTQAIARHRAMGTVERTRYISRQALADAIEKAERHLQPDDRFDVTGEAQFGQRMSTRDLCDKLRACNQNLFFEVSLADKTKMGAYAMLPDKYKPWETVRVKTFLIGFPNGFGYCVPEFTQRMYEWKEMPDPDNPSATKRVREFTDQVRGWRAVLALLLRRGIIDAHGIREQFPRLWRDSQHWHTEVGNIG